MGNETKPTLDGLIEWLEGEPPEMKYHYLDHHDCLAARYFRSIGQPYNPVVIDKCSPKDPRAQIENVGCNGGSTYRTALAYARALRDSQ